MFYAALAVFFKGVDNRFRVGMRLEFMAERFQLALQLAEVVNLAIKNNGDFFITAGDGLVSAREVDDGKTAHAERDFAFNHHPLIVRPAMTYRAAHAVEHDTRLLRVACFKSARVYRSDESSDAAHKILFSSTLQY